MSSSFVQLAVVTVILFVLQGLAALPWIFAWRQRPLGQQLPLVGKILGSMIVVGLLAAVFFDYNSDPQVLSGWGRIYMAVLLGSSWSTAAVTQPGSMKLSGVWFVGRLLSYQVL